MSLIQPQAKVQDIVSETQATGNGPWTVFNVAGVTSGQIYDKITEANMALQSWVGGGLVNSAVAGSPLAIEQVKRFEVVYGSARLAADLVNITITDGFNYNIGGLAVQRAGAQMQAYTKFIDDHLKVSKEYIKAFHQWFWTMNPDVFQGWSEYGTPVHYWSVSNPRYG